MDLEWAAVCCLALRLRPCDDVLSGFSAVYRHCPSELAELVEFALDMVISFGELLRCEELVLADQILNFLKGPVVAESRVYLRRLVAGRHRIRETDERLEKRGG